MNKGQKIFWNMVTIAGAVVSLIWIIGLFTGLDINSRLYDAGVAVLCLLLSIKVFKIDRRDN